MAEEEDLMNRYYSALAGRKLTNAAKKAMPSNAGDPTPKGGATPRKWPKATPSRVFAARPGFEVIRETPGGSGGTSFDTESADR